MLGANIFRGEETEKWSGMRGGLYRGASVRFFAFDNTNNSNDCHAGFFGRFDGGDGGSTGGANVVDDHDASAFPAETFYATTGAMGFLCFANEESVE